MLINRTTLGYEVRAVGFNPDAAAYGGINVKKNLIRAMAISGAFAGLAGVIDMLGGTRLPVRPARHPVQPGRLHRHRRRPARAEHRDRHPPRGVPLRRPPLRDASTGLGSSSVIDPELAGNLTYIIQGLIVLFIGADVLILYVWDSRKKLRRGGPRTPAAEAAA